MQAPVEEVATPVAHEETSEPSSEDAIPAAENVDADQTSEDTAKAPEAANADAEEVVVAKAEVEESKEDDGRPKRTGWWNRSGFL